MAEKRAPSDEAGPGTADTGEDACPECHGTGRFDGEECVTCAGTGVVIESVGGA